MNTPKLFEEDCQFSLDEMMLVDDAKIGEGSLFEDELEELPIRDRSAAEIGEDSLFEELEELPIRDRSAAEIGEDSLFEELEELPIRDRSAAEIGEDSLFEELEELPIRDRSAAEIGEGSLFEDELEELPIRDRGETMEACINDEDIIIEENKWFNDIQMKKHQSALDNICLCEPLDRNKIALLLKNEDVLLAKETEVEKTFKRNRYQQLKSYSDLSGINIDGQECIYITYKRKGTYGRSFPESSGLYHMSKVDRHTLAAKYFDDWDIVNSGPTLCYNFCLQHKDKFGNMGRSQSALTDYIFHREERLNEVVTRYDVSEEKAKDLYISLFHGASFKTWRRNNEIHDEVIPSKIADFIREMRRIRKIIVDENSHMEETIRNEKLQRGKAVTNIEGSIFAYVIQEIEIRLLEIVFLYAKGKGLIENNICVLCSDGIMIQKKHSHPELGQEFSAEIKALTGFTVYFKCKPMDKGITDLSQKHTFTLHKKGFNTMAVAQDFKEQHDAKDFICVDQKLYHYNGIYWKPDPHHVAITKFLTETYVSTTVRTIKKMREKLEAKLRSLSTEMVNIQQPPHPMEPPIIASTKSNKKKGGEISNEKPNKRQKMTTEETPETLKLKKEIDQLNEYERGVKRILNSHFRASFIKDIIVQLTNDNIQLDANGLLFPFENRIWDFQNDRWIEPNPEFFITKTCGYAYDGDNNGNNVSKVTKNQLHEVFKQFQPKKENREYTLDAFSTSLLGIQIPKLFVLHGPGGCGKSVVTELLLETAGNFGGILPPSVLSSVITPDGANPQLASKHKERCTVASEPKKGSVLVSATWKSLTGDNSICVRNLYEAVKKLKITTTLWVVTNNMLLHDEVSSAEERRLEYIECSSRFRNASTHKKEIDTFPDALVDNPIYKEEKWRRKARSELFDMLKDRAHQFLLQKQELGERPDDFIRLTDDAITKSDPLIRWMRQAYESTGNIYDHHITIKELREEFTKSVAYKLLLPYQQSEYETTAAVVEKIRTNKLFQESFKKRNATVTKEGCIPKRIGCDKLVGWKRINPFASKPEDDDVYDE